MSNNSYASGIGIEMILFLVFLVLKLTNNIDGSWWWVTCPLWIGFGIAFVCLILTFLLAYIYRLLK